MAISLNKTGSCIGLALGILGGLTACDSQTVEAAQAYEVVTQMRPESRDVYLKPFRRNYDACASVRAMQHLPPPPPLVTLPADFALKRSTYLSGGGAYLIRHEEFRIVMEESSCKTSIDSTTTEALVRGGQVYGQRRELDGSVEVEDPMPAPQSPQDASAFTEKKTVGGLALRCVSAVFHDKLMQERCAADTGAGVLRDGVGEPIVLHERAFVPVFDMVVLTEPVRVQVGKPVSPERIALSVAK